MGDLSTRPPHIRHQRLERVAPALVAALVLVINMAHATTERPISSTSQVPEITLPASGEMAITTVPKGHEGLELSARYTENGNVLVDNIAWKISDQDQAIVYEKTTSLVKVALRPGQYHIEASFGTAHLKEAVSVKPGTKLGLNYVINAGALRILPRVKGVEQFELASTSKVFALSGIEQGKLIVTSNMPGEVLNVTAGDYRIESRFASGNTVAVTDIHVKAGFMSAVNIDHIAGIAKLSIGGLFDQNVQWVVTDEQGTVINGTNAQFILKPGHYVASVWLGSQNLKSDFLIAPGETQEIDLSK